MWPDGQSSASPLYTKCPGRLADIAGRGRGLLAWPGACLQRLELLLVLEVPFLALGSAWPSAAGGQDRLGSWPLVAPVSCCLEPVLELRCPWHPAGPPAAHWSWPWRCV